MSQAQYEKKLSDKKKPKKKDNYQLGLRHQREGDHVKAFECFLNYSKSKKNPITCYYVAEYLLRGIPKYDVRRAMIWLRHSAEKKYTKALYKLGKLMMEKSLELEKALEYLEEAYQKKNELEVLPVQCFMEILFIYEKLLLHNNEKIKELYTEFRNQISNIIEICEENKQYYPKTIFHIYSYFNKMDFSLDVKTKLAECYYKGIGVEKDDYMAISIYSELSEMGHVESMFQSGLILIQNIPCYSEDEFVQVYSQGVRHVINAKKYEPAEKFIKNCLSFLRLEEKGERECCICMEKNIEIPVRMKECHKSHTMCLNCYIRLRLSSNKNCPMCRRPTVRLR